MALAIPESTIEEIKARTDLGELVASYGIQVRHAGSSLTACCPFHREKTPSFHINVAKGFYHCFGCGESGDAIKFVQKQEGLTFMEAVRKLAGRCGIEIKEKEDPNAGRRKRLYALMAELAQFYHRCLGRMRSAQIARDYLAGRDLDERAQSDFIIGYAPDGADTMLQWAAKNNYTPDELVAAGILKEPRSPGDGYFHRFGGRLMFTVRDRQGRVVAFSGRQLVENKRSGKYVNSPETEIFKKSNVLYGFDRAAGNIAKSPHREVIVCEGQIDCIRLHISGFPVAVASQGTAFTDEHVKMLSRVADSAVLVFDDDAAGHKAAIRSAGMLLAASMPVRVVRLPDGDDPDSFLRKKGAEQFQRLLDGAESVVGFQCRIERAKEVNPGSIDAVSRITKAVLSTIAQCSNAVLRSSMVGEAAKLLNIPAIALSEELGKVKVVRSEELGHIDDDVGPEPLSEEPFQPLQSDDLPKAVLPPPPREIALMAFLMANEYDRTLAGMLASFLPDDVFAHDFTRRFASVWREQVERGEDCFGAFAETLSDEERKWFDVALLDAGKTQASALGATDIMQDFVRSLWCDRLERRRGELDAAATDAETLAERMKLAMDLKLLRQVRWGKVKEIIENFTKGEI